MVHQLDKRGCVSLSTLEPRLEGWPAASHLQVTARSVNGYNNSFDLLVKDLKQWKKAGYRVVLPVSYTHLDVYKRQYLERKGAEFLEESAVYRKDGKMQAIYLKEEIGGFAVHLVRNPESLKK